MKLNKHKGFTLVELIIFIVIIGVSVSSLITVYRTALKNTPTGNYQTTAIELAQGRMEIILGQKRLKGFTSFSDPCPAAAVCSIPASLSDDFTIVSNVVNTTISGDSNYKIITVTVTGPQNSRASLKTLVARY
jgi:prepilin-type N-terminal cleavage/methylation domain-containing protein